MEVLENRRSKGEYIKKLYTYDKIVVRISMVTAGLDERRGEERAGEGRRGEERSGRRGEKRRGKERSERREEERTGEWRERGEKKRRGGERKGKERRGVERTEEGRKGEDRRGEQDTLGGDIWMERRVNTTNISDTPDTRFYFRVNLSLQTLLALQLMNILRLSSLR